VALDGRRKILAHTHIHSQFQVSKYGVDVEGFESFLESLNLLAPASNVVVIDEIGQQLHEGIGYSSPHLPNDLRRNCLNTLLIREYGRGTSTQRLKQLNGPRSSDSSG
jgi:hypothetical protein